MKQFQKERTTNDSHVIAYEIKKLNKLIVAEQAYSEIYTHKNSTYVPLLEEYLSFDKKVILLVNAKVQAIYDMKNLQVEMDSVNKKIRIDYIPPVEIQVYPEVKFYDMDQSILNSFDQDELNQIQEKAIDHIKSKVDTDKLKQEAHKQLIENLSEIYLLAKTYGWEIEDKTMYAKEIEREVH